MESLSVIIGPLFIAYGHFLETIIFTAIMVAIFNKIGLIYNDNQTDDNKQI